MAIPTIDEQVMQSPTDQLGLEMMAKASGALDPSLDPRMADEEYRKLFDFTEAITYLKQMITAWDSEVEQTKTNRLTRDLEVDVEGLRSSKELEADETFIPNRVIDSNIRREQPAYVQYIKAGRRLAIFSNRSEPQKDSTLLEEAFTKGMTYNGWETPYLKVIDGAATHGWDSIEVVFDETKPLHVGIEHVGHDMLILPVGCTNFQDAPVIIRAYDITINKLKSYVSKFGFDEDQINRLTEKHKDTAKKGEPIRIYKKFCKYEDQVYVGWFSIVGDVSDWLKKPEALYLGIRHQEEQIKETISMVPDPTSGQMIPMILPVPEQIWVDTPISIYPIFLLPYAETEKPKVTDHKGRVYLDAGKQEASTAIMSAFVNKLLKAQDVYGSPKQDDSSGAAPAQTNLKLSHGKILNKPFEFWSLQDPNPTALTALQFMDVANSQEVGQPSFAAQNRQDSRKTAKEIEAATQQQNNLNSVQVTNLSIFLRDVCSFVWIIVQSQAMQDKITLIVDPQNPEQQWYEIIDQDYDIRPAGDVDVIQRAEKIGQMRQDWPVIANTPLALRFLADYIRLSYPEKGEQYASVIEQTGSMMQLIQELSTVVAGTLDPKEISELPVEQKSYLVNLQQRVQQTLAPMQKPNTTQQ